MQLGIATVCLLSRGLGLHLRALGNGIVDCPDHVERLLWQAVVLAVKNLKEALDCIIACHILAGQPSEYLANEEWLRQETLNLPRTGDSQLIFC